MVEADRPREMLATPSTHGPAHSCPRSSEGCTDRECQSSPVPWSGRGRAGWSFVRSPAQPGRIRLRQVSWHPPTGSRLANPRSLPGPAEVQASLAQVHARSVAGIGHVG